MPDESDQSIDAIVQIANQDVRDAISTKIERSVTNDESAAIATFIGTDYCWARAEELLMFARHRDASEVLSMIEKLATRYRDGTLLISDMCSNTTKRVIPCDMCGATGICYCMRKGTGTADGCPRCGGTEKCRHCNGTGVR